MSAIWGIRQIKRKLEERKAKRENEIASDRAARITTKATVWIAVFTVVLALVGILTLIEVILGGADTAKLAQAAVDQAAAMKLQEQRTEILTTATTAQAIATQTAADAAKSAAETGTAALKQSEKAFIVEQRPYLVTEIPTFIPAAIVAGQGITANINTKNIGRTPARKMLNHIRLEPYHPSDRATIINFMNGLFADLRRRDSQSRRETETTAEAGEDLAPGATTFSTNDPPPILTGVEVNALLADPQPAQTTVLYYVGVISYTDAFKVPYATEFCYIYFGRVLTTWHICDNHNSIK
jgi:hypothetical protein